MQFRFFGVSKWTGKLVGDATAVDDIDLWTKSRGIDTSGAHPFGARPTPSCVESYYYHEPTYVLQKDADIFFE
jgi:hypothetical protein